MVRVDLVIEFENHQRSDRHEEVTVVDPHRCEFQRPDRWTRWAGDWNNGGLWHNHDMMALGLDLTGTYYRELQDALDDAFGPAPWL